MKVNIRFRMPIVCSWFEEMKELSKESLGVDDMFITHLFVLDREGGNYDSASG